MIRWPGKGRKRELPGAACLPACSGCRSGGGGSPFRPSRSAPLRASAWLGRAGGAARGCDPWAGAAPPVLAAAWPEGEGGRAAAASLPSHCRASFCFCAATWAALPVRLAAGGCPLRCRWSGSGGAGRGGRSVRGEPAWGQLQPVPLIPRPAGAALGSVGAALPPCPDARGQPRGEPRRRCERGQGLGRLPRRWPSCRARGSACPWAVAAAAGPVGCTDGLVRCEPRVRAVAAAPGAARLPVALRVTTEGLDRTFCANGRGTRLLLRCRREGSGLRSQLSAWPWFCLDVCVNSLGNFSRATEGHELSICLTVQDQSLGT